MLAKSAELANGGAGGGTNFTTVLFFLALAVRRARLLPAQPLPRPPPRSLATTVPSMCVHRARASCAGRLGLRLVFTQSGYGLRPRAAANKPRFGLGLRAADREDASSSVAGRVVAPHVESSASVRHHRGAAVPGRRRPGRGGGSSRTYARTPAVMHRLHNVPSGGMRRVAATPPTAHEPVQADTCCSLTRCACIVLVNRECKTICHNKPPYI